eukprot:8076114-Prorocentrum_lima.AAC.1
MAHDKSAPPALSSAQETFTLGQQTLAQRQASWDVVDLACPIIGVQIKWQPGLCKDGNAPGKLRVAQH